MRMAGVTFGLAVGAVAILLVFLGALNISYFVRSSGETPQINLGVGLAFSLTGAMLGWAAWWTARRM
jgi:hypothetical protein